MSLPLPRAVAATFFLVADLLAQGSAPDFERANTLEARTRDRVYRFDVRPQWIDSRRCWYRVETGYGRSEFLRVSIDDSGRARREPLFDANELASQLSAALDTKIDPVALPLANVEVEGDSIRFRANGRSFQLDSGKLSPRQVAPRRLEPLRSDRRPTRSRNGGANVRIVFVNDLDEPVTLDWIDGSGVATRYSTLEPGGRFGQNTYVGHLWIAQRASGGETIAFMARRETQDDDEAHIVVPSARTPEPPKPPGVTSPDGAFRVFTRDHDLYAVETATGNERRLTSDGSPTHEYRDRIEWSPDSQRFVGYVLTPGDRREITLVESSPRDQLQPKTRTVRYDKPGDRLDTELPVLIDPRAGVIPIESAERFANPTFGIDIRFDPNGKHFTFDYDERGHTRWQVVEVDTSNGATRTLFEDVTDTFLDSTQKTILTHLDRDRSLLLDSERSGWNHLYRVDRDSGEIRALTEGEFVVRRLVHVDEERRTVEFMAMGLRKDEDPYHEHLCRVNFDGTGFVRLTEGDGTHEVEFSPDRSCFIDRWSRVDLPTITELRDRDGKLLLELERGDASDLVAAGWSLPERFHATGRDGTTAIHGLIVKPSNFDPKKTYPVVEKIYAGPHDYHVPKGFSRLVQEHEYAELGFIVVMIDGMGTNWRSKAFHDICFRNLKDAGLPDRIAWIRAAAQTRPYLDLSRVGIFGGSAGGQNAVAALLHHGDFYRVAAADCGCHDNRMDKTWWNEAWMGYPVGPWYAENSNVTHAGKLTGKLLLVVGELDDNVDPSSTLQVVDALIRADKDFDFLLVPGAGHGAAESPYGNRRRMDFLVRHLHGVEPRWVP